MMFVCAIYAEGAPSLRFLQGRVAMLPTRPLSFCTNPVLYASMRPWFPPFANPIFHIFQAGRTPVLSSRNGNHKVKTKPSIVCGQARGAGSMNANATRFVQNTEKLHRLKRCPPLLYGCPALPSSYSEVMFPTAMPLTTKLLDNPCLCFFGPQLLINQ